MRYCRQAGMSLVGFMFVVVIIGLAVVLAMQIVPSAMEYIAVKKAVKTAAAANSPREIQESFDKQRTTAYIDSVTGRDLTVEKTDNGFVVSVAYQKKIHLVGPASLVLDYEASSH